MFPQATVLKPKRLQGQMCLNNTHSKTLERNIELIAAILLEIEVSSCQNS